MHICWELQGRHPDIPLAKMLDVCMRARPAALYFEGGDPRRAPA